jgi:hypothetical protein
MVGWVVDLPYKGTDQPHKNGLKCCKLIKKGSISLAKGLL